MYCARHAILIIVFNRPAETAMVLEAVRRVHPPRIYVSADAPRIERPGDRVLCDATLRLFDDVARWCDVTLRVSSGNRGSHTHIPEAVGWFFENEDAGIVLEDDCVPNVDFFWFCDELLDLYADCPEVMWINGSNLGYTAPVCGNAVYGFSRYALSWGWASWRRAWTDFDFRHTETPRATPRESRPGGGGLRARAERIFWFLAFSYAFSINNWDWRWLYHLRSKRGFAATPYANLIANIGYGIEAVHGGRATDWRAQIGTAALPRKALRKVRRVYDEPFDRFLERALYKVGVLRALKLGLVVAFPWLRNAFRALRGKSI